MLGIDLTQQEKIGIAVGGGLLAMIALAPMFLGSSSSKGARSTKATDTARRDRALEKAEARIRTLEAERERLDAAASKAATPAKAKRIKAAAAKTETKRDDLEEIAAKVERGEISGRELGELVNSGKLKIRNPAPTALAAAMADSEAFHGEPREVVKLTEAERCIPHEWQTVIGDLVELSYRTPDGSIRHNTIWDHRIGDGGRFGDSTTKPLLVEDPETHLIHLVQGDARTRFNAHWGILD